MTRKNQQKYNFNQTSRGLIFKAWEAGNRRQDNYHCVYIESAPTTPALRAASASRRLISRKIARLRSARKGGWDVIDSAGPAPGRH